MLAEATFVGIGRIQSVVDPDRGVVGDVAELYRRQRFLEVSRPLEEPEPFRNQN